MDKLILSEESKAILQEHAEFTKKWIEGLRSGEYTQVQEAMVDPEIPSSACCLMVAEIVNGRKWEDHKYACNYDEDGECFEVAALPSDLSSEIHWTENLYATYLSDEGNYIKRKPSPPTWNDDIGLSFNQIADLLEYGEVECEQI